jgi:hypothetical protein
MVPPDPQGGDTEEQAMLAAADEVIRQNRHTFGIEPVSHLARCARRTFVKRSKLSSCEPLRSRLTLIWRPKIEMIAEDITNSVFTLRVHAKWGRLSDDHLIAPFHARGCGATAGDRDPSV